MLTASYFINQATAKNQFITVFKQMRENQGQNSFGPDGFNPKHLDPKEPPFAEFNKERLKRPDLEMMLHNAKPPGRGPGLDRKLFPLYGLLLIYFASISVKVLLRLRDDEKKRDHIMKERISTELLHLKQQINPHFLFNTLNNIYALSIKNPEVTPAAILKVSSILRYTLYKSGNSLALLKDEIEIINSYIDFQKMRSKNSLPIKYDVKGTVNHYKIEPFILLPLIENAFKYGMADINNSFINIQITINSDKFNFFISNKKSFVKEFEGEYTGIGLKNIKRRLDLVYPDCHKLKILDEDEIFSVFLEIPLKSEKDEMYRN